MPSPKFCLLKLTQPTNLYSRRHDTFINAGVGTYVLGFHLNEWQESSWYSYDDILGRFKKEDKKVARIIQNIHVLLYRDYLRGVTLARLKYPTRYSSTIYLQDLEVVHPEWENIVQGHKNKDKLYTLETVNGKTIAKVIAQPGVLPVEQQMAAPEHVPSRAEEIVRNLEVLFRNPAMRRG